MSELTQNQVEEIVEATVIKTLGELGVDLTTVEARREWIEDMLYMRAWRKSVQRGAKVGFLTAITVIVTGFLGIAWLGLMTAFHGAP